MSLDMAEVLWERIVSWSFPIIWAALVLFVGWIVSHVIAKAGARLVERVTAGAQVQGLIESHDRSQIARIVRRVIFYLLMVFVLVQVFDILGVHAVRDPFLAMASELAAAVPNLVKAVFILLAAWVVATLARGVAVRLFGRPTFGRLLGWLDVAEGDDGRAQLAKRVGDLVFFIALVMFLPAILGALRLEGLQGPFEQVVAQAFSFAPKLVAAGVTVSIGYIAAKVVRGILTHFFAKIGTDQLPEKVGLGQVFQTTPLSASLGHVAFALVLIPLVISAFESLGVTAISGPAISMLTLVLNMVPSVIVAILLVIVGVAVSRWISRLAVALMESLHVTRFLAQWGLVKSEQAERAVPVALGNIVTGVIMLAVLVEVLEVLRFFGLSGILRSLLLYLPHVGTAVVILAAGFAVGEYAGRNLKAVLEQTHYPVGLSNVARYAILLLAGMMAFEQLGVAESIVVNAFTILLGSVGLGVAIAIGLGSKDFVQRWIDKATESRTGTSRQEKHDPEPGQHGLAG